MSLPAVVSNDTPQLHEAKRGEKVETSAIDRASAISTASSLRFGSIPCLPRALSIHGIYIRSTPPRLGNLALHPPKPAADSTVAHAPTSIPYTKHCLI